MTTTSFPFPDLGVEPGIPISTAWSNPLITHQLHNSHIETLTSMCAHRFEREYVLLDPSKGGSTQAMSLGTASHRVIEDLIKGKLDPNVTFTKTLNEHWDNIVEPNLDPGADPQKRYEQYHESSLSAIQWTLRNLDIRRTQHEKTWVLDPASDVIAGIDDSWSMAGTLDVVEFDFDKRLARIFDYKFRERFNYERNSKSSQPIVYALALQAHGWQTEFSFIETVKGQTKEQKILITPARIEWASERVRQSIRMIETGVFPIQTGGWHCSAAYCRFWKNCRGKYEDE